MINIDPETGDSSGVALKVLAGYRRERANILFGQFLAWDPAPHLPPPADARTGDREGGGFGRESAVAGAGGGARGIVVEGETGGRAPLGRKPGTGDAAVSGAGDSECHFPPGSRGVTHGREGSKDKGVVIKAGEGEAVGREGVGEKGMATGEVEGKVVAVVAGVEAACGSLRGDGGWTSWVSEGMEVDAEA